MGTIPAPDIFHDAAQIAQMPEQAYAQDVTLKGEQQRQRQVAQQMEVQRRQLADQDALTKAMSAFDPAKNKPEDIPHLITQNGGSGQAALAAQQHVLQLRDTASQIASRDAATGGAQIDTLLKRHDAALGLFRAAEQVPDEQLGDHLQSAIYQAHQQGWLSADEFQHGMDLAQTARQDPTKARSALPAYENGFKTEKQIFQEAKDQAEINQKNTQQQTEQWQVVPELGVRVNKVTGQTTPISGAAMTPPMMEAHYVQLQQKQNLKQPLAAEDKAFIKSYEKMKTLVPVANFNLQNAGASADAGGNPSQIAQAIAENRMKWTEAVSPRTPQSVKNSIMAQVFKLNPNYDTSEFGLETDAAKKARSGAWADTRIAYNTAIDHSKQLLDAIDALNGGDTKRLNSLKNFFKTEFGSPDVPTYQAIANAYNHEVTSVVSKNHITDAEVQSGHAVLPDNASPQQLRGVVSAYNSLMQSKRDELDKIIKAGAGGKASGVLGVGSSGQAAATRSYQGHTYTQQADGSWKLTN